MDRLRRAGRADRPGNRGGGAGDSADAGDRRDRAEQRAHHLAAALLRYLTDDNHKLTVTLRALATELRRGTEHPDASALPTTLTEVTDLVDAGDGVRFGDVVAALCADPETAEQALTDLLATAATLHGNIDRHLNQWEPVIAAVTAVTELLDRLGETTQWAALVAALRRVLAGDRDREQLLAGLDEVDTAILTATLDRLPTDPGQEMTSPASLDALTDPQVVRVLALVVDHHSPLPDPARLRELDATLADAAKDPDLQPYQRPGTPPPSDGDLARATLAHLAATRPELTPVIDRGVRLAEDTTRFEPATLAVGGLVLLALQTEVKIERNAAGRWQFRLHKKAMRDSTLGRLLGQLLAPYTNPPQQ